MILISFITALLMLLIFRYASNQQKIHQAKNKIKAHLLELRLFKDNLGISLKAQGSILRYNLKYISCSIKPLLVMIIPLILILIQLNLWFGQQSLSIGQKAILKVKLEEGHNPIDTKISIKPSTGFEIETFPLRIEDEREINWRLLAQKKGVHDLVIAINGHRIAKKVAVAQKPLSKISSIKVRQNFINELFNPGESPIHTDLPIKSIEIVYPSKTMNLFGWDIPSFWNIPSWLIAYFALSIIIGFVFKGVFKVEI